MSPFRAGLRRPIAWTVLVLALLAGPAAVADEASGAVDLSSCFLPRVPTPVQCGSHRVPEDRGTPGGREIDLRVVVLPALERPPRPDPLYILAGGPGQSAVAIAPLIRAGMGRVNRVRDIVLVDQRGTGRSNPLDCDFDLDELAFDDDRKREAVAECLDELDADPRHYTTVNHIEDLESVRGALGHERINLYGGSYGTRVALVYLREHPESLRAVVMDAVAPMDMRVGLEMGADAQRAFDAVIDRCADDPACHEAFPGLAARFQQLLAQLEAEPVSLTLPHPMTGAMETQPIDHRNFALALRGILYTPATRRLVPLVIDEAANGNWAPLVGLTISASESLLEVMTPGLLFAVLCAEDLADIRPDDIPQAERDSFVGTAQVDEFLGFCRAWPDPLVTADFSPPNSDLPVLLLSGELDPVTPPYRAESAAATLTNSRHIVVPNGGHTVAGQGCVPVLLAEFLETADPAALDADCVDEVAFPSFFVSRLGPRP